MWDFIHIWHVRHGVPETEDQVVGINDRLVQLGDEAEPLPLRELVDGILGRYGCASVEPIVRLDEDDFPSDGGVGADAEAMQLWRSDPLLAYKRLRPAALRLRLASSTVEFFPCAYEILRFCRSRSLVAVRGQPWWPACWQPSGFETKRGPLVGQHATHQWSGLESVLEPGSVGAGGAVSEDAGSRGGPATPAAALRPTWAIVARQLESAFAGQGFTGWADLNGARFGELRARFARRTPAGEQQVAWRMSPVSGAGEQASRDLCMRMGISMRHEELWGSFYNVMPTTGSSELFACELSEFLAPAKPDAGDLFMAHRDEWGPDSERVSIEEPANLLRVLSILQGHAIPFLDRCTTPAGTLEALCEARYPFLHRPLPKMVLAWHVQDLERYGQLKARFRERMKHAMSAEEFARGSRKLEATPPLFAA